MTTKDVRKHMPASHPARMVYLRARKLLAKNINYDFRGFDADLEDYCFDFFWAEDDQLLLRLYKAHHAGRKVRVEDLLDEYLDDSAARAVAEYTKNMGL